MSGPDDHSNDTVGGWRLPDWLRHLPQLGWVFLALAALQAMAEFKRIVGDQQAPTDPTEWLAVLAQLIEAVGAIAIVLLPVAALARRPGIWRESEPLFLGAVLLALGELLPIVPSFIPIATPSIEGIARGVVLGSPLDIVAPISFAAGIAFIAFGVPHHADAPLAVHRRARTGAYIGVLAALARVANIVAYALIVGALVVTPVSTIVDLLVRPLDALFIAVLAFRAVGSVEDARRDRRERRVTATAAVLWVSSTLVGAIVALVLVVSRAADGTLAIVALTIVALLSTAAAVAMLVAYALGMSEARLRVAAAGPAPIEAV